MAKFCSKCGRALTNENAAFCPGCGACLTPAANNNPAPVIPPVNSGVVQKAPAPVPPAKPVTPTAPGPINPPASKPSGAPSNYPPVNNKAAAGKPVKTKKKSKAGPVIIIVLAVLILLAAFVICFIKGFFGLDGARDNIADKLSDTKIGGILGIEGASASSSSRKNKDDDDEDDDDEDAKDDKDSKDDKSDNKSEDDKNKPATENAGAAPEGEKTEAGTESTEDRVYSGKYVLVGAEIGSAVYGSEAIVEMGLYGSSITFYENKTAFLDIVTDDPVILTYENDTMTDGKLAVPFVFEGYNVSFSYDNAKLIFTLEAFAPVVPTPTPTPTATPTPAKSEWIFEDSDSRYISESELYGLSQWECLVARNEIYARRGRMFSTQSLADYFAGCSWYNGTISPNSFQASVFNEYENKNIATIQAYEKKQGW